MDMTKVRTAQHGWVYLHAIVDCCTRELVGWNLELRGPTDEAIACVEQAVTERQIPFGQFKKRVAWRADWESLDQARRDIADYIATYHHRPHSGLAYLTPAEVAQTRRTIDNPAP